MRMRKVSGRVRSVSGVRLAAAAGLVGLTVLAAMPARAQGGLNYINEKDGGHVVFGRLSNVSSMPEAMGFMLRNVHSKFEERPEVGKFFQTKGSNSVATFFTLTAKNNTGHALTGMVIVSMPPGGTASAALLYDETPHFTKSVNVMMKHLDEAMAHEGMGGGGTANGGGGQAGVAAPLRQTRFPDGSGSIGLPAGWRITSSYMGGVSAEGPNGSQVTYGVQIPVMDPSNPQMRQQIQNLSQGGRAPLPGMYVAYPYGGDPVRALVSVAAQLAQKRRVQAPAIESSSVKDEGNAVGGHCMRVIGQIDRHDNKGVLAMNAVLCETQPQGGNYTMTLYEEDVRPEAKAQEQATMDAIGKSFRVDNGVVGQEQQGEINHINDVGAAAKARADASGKWLDQQDAARTAANANAAYPSSSSSAGSADERHNQDFSNYQRDLSVITDTQTGEHATTYNNWADALVKADPNRYQYVTTPNLLKGIDY